MPLYEYECDKCGGKFELRRAITDCEDDIKCPECEDEYLRKVFSAFGISSSGKGCVPAPSGGSA